MVEFIGGQQGWIYLITNIVSNKKYVGQTTSSIKDRWLSHRKRTGLYGDLLCDDIKVYGESSFTIEVLHETRDIQELDSLEILEIEKLNTLHPAGYNMTPGGTQIGEFLAERIARSRTQNRTTLTPKPMKTKITKKQNNPTAKRRKPVIGTNILTGEVIRLNSMSSDSRFDVRLISACCRGKRQYHRNCRWEYDNTIHG